jgi:hypothetical protein
MEAVGWYAVRHFHDSRSDSLAISELSWGCDPGRFCYVSVGFLTYVDGANMNKEGSHDAHVASRC